MNKSLKETVDEYLKEHFEQIENWRTGFSSCYDPNFKGLEKFNWQKIADDIYTKTGNLHLNLTNEYIRSRFIALRKSSKGWMEIQMNKLEKEGKKQFEENILAKGIRHHEFPPDGKAIWTGGGKQHFHYEYKENKAKGEAEYKFTADHTPTEEEIIDWFKIDTKKYRINQIYHKTSFGNKYSITVSLLAIKGIESEDYIGKFEDFVKQYNETIFIKPKEELDPNRSWGTEDLLYLCTLADLHIGNYQKKGYTESIKKTIFETFKSVSDSTKKIVILNTGDIVHTDTSKNQTWGGTQLDSGASYEDAFTEGLDLITALIDYAASKVESVTFVNVRGNHSFDTEFCLGEALKRIYKGQKNIEIINQTDTRIYYYWNNNAFLFTHGDKAIDRLPLLFATEGREAFQQADNHHIILGHLHYSKSKQFVDDSAEFAGINVRVVGSPTSNDVWHKQNGFVQNKKSLISMLFTPTEGKYAEFQFKL